jgi:hypothetical protein
MASAGPLETGRASGLTRAVLALVAGSLCVAAFAAVVAIVSGDFSEADWKVIASSILLALASSTGGAGVALRAQATGAARLLGTAVVGASAATFALVNIGLWADVEGDVFWRVTAVLAIVALDGAHACFVLTRRRRTDPDPAELATRVAAVASAISATLGISAVSGADGPWQLLAVVLVVQLLATALAPILRRMDADRPASVTAPRSIAGELQAIADQLDAAAHSEAAVHRLADQLRGVARRARRE